MLASCLLWSVQVANKIPSPVLEIQTVLTWLPVDTETIVVADVRKGSFLTVADLKSQEEREDKNPVLSVKQLAALFEAESVSFISLKRPLAKLLDTREIRFAIEGSRHFRPPKNLGTMPYEGCQILVFARSLASAGELFMKDHQKLGMELREIDKQTVAVFQEHFEEDVWRFFVALPQDNVLLIATNQNYLQEVLARMKTPPGDRALPETLPEWKYVNTHAPFWGIRHYDTSQANLDPTSPFGGGKAANQPDDQAIGVVFAFDPNDGRTATVTYLSNNESMLEIFKRSQHPEEVPALVPSFKQLGKGVAQASFQLSEAESVAYFFLILETALGHGTYL